MRKTVIYLFLNLLISLSYSSNICFTQWIQTNGPYGGPVNCFTSSGSNIFLGSDGGIFLSTNNGTSWAVINNGLTNLRIRALTVSGTNIFAGTQFGGVFISTNNGTNWSSVNNGLTNLDICSFAVSGINIFAGTSGGVFRSTNNGGNWIAVNSGLTELYIPSIAIMGSNIFVGTTGGVFRSTNNGDNWSSVNTGISSLFIHSLAVSGTSIFAGGYKIYRSTNYGGNWTQVYSGYPIYFIEGLTVLGTNIFACGYGGVLLSENNGGSWSQVGLTTRYARTLYSDGTSVYAGTTYGAFSTSNNGTNWSEINNGFNGHYVYSMTFSGTNIFAGTYSGGIFLSSNNGENWIAVNNGITDFHINALETCNSKIFTGAYERGVFKSTDNGSYWTQVNNGLTDSCINALAVSDTFILAGAYRELFFSSNEGVNWIPRGFTNGVSSLTFFGPYLFIGTSGVYRSTNYGINWINSGLTNQYITSFAFSNTNIFAGDPHNGGVFLSTNYGDSWNAVNNGLTNLEVYGLAAYGTNILAATHGGGVFLSKNSGTNWINRNEGFGITPPVRTFLIIDNYIFAGTGSRSVWRRNLSEILSNTPISPSLISPSNNSLYLSLTPELIWDSVSGASSYKVEVSIDSTFTNILDSNTLITTKYSIPNGKLNFNTKYYWRVNGYNEYGSGPWSSVWNFRTLNNLTLNLKVYLEGFWNGIAQTSDTVNVYLANSTTPYKYADSSKVVLSSNGTGTLTFTKCPNGNYYIVVIHRNHLETWCRLTKSFVVNVPVNYDFTTTFMQAYGYNMVYSYGKWCLYGGDINQDGFVDGADMALLDNDLFNYASGYVVTDLNGDQFVDGADMAILDNNLYNYIGVVRPSILLDKRKDIIKTEESTEAR